MFVSLLCRSLFMYLGFFCRSLFMNIGLFWHTCRGSRALSQSRPACRAQRESLFYWSLLMCVGLFCRSLFMYANHSACRAQCTQVMRGRTYELIYMSSWQIHVWHDSFICVTWLLHTCVMNYLYARHVVRCSRVPSRSRPAFRWSLSKRDLYIWK